MESSLTYQVVFMLNFLFTYFLMKVVSWFCTPGPRRGSAFLFFTTPYLSVRSLRYNKEGDPRAYFLHFFTFAVMTALTVSLAYIWLRPLNYGKVLLISPAVYFLTESMGAFGQF